MKKYTQISFAIIFLILGIALSLQYKSIQKNKSITNPEGKTIQDVQAQLLAQKERNDELDKKNQEYEQKIGNYEKNVDVDKMLKDDLEKANLLAGLSNAKGKGITIKIDDTKTTNFDGIVPSSQGYFVTDANLLELLNELRAAGAEAISINEERILSTTEVRKAGSFMRINNKNYNSPFVVKVIGDPNVLEGSLGIREGIIEYLKLNRVDITITSDDNISIPKYNGVVNFKYLTKM